MINRREEIKKKGFSINNLRENPEVDFSKIKVGIKNLDDAILTTGELKRINPELAKKENVLNAIQNGEYNKMREISNFFYKTSGIYSRLCRYMAYLYRYDWAVTPYINSKSVSTDKILSGFYKALNYLEDFGVKKFFGEVALKVIRNGCYYGYLIR